MRFVLLALLVVGCAENRPEIAWQSLHLADTLQTVQIARSSCFKESSYGTQRIIGEHPSVGGALAWGIGTAVGHWGLSKWIDNSDAPRWVKWTWHSLSIGTTAAVVKDNHDQGIGFTGTDC